MSHNCEIVTQKHSNDDGEIGFVSYKQGRPCWEERSRIWWYEGGLIMVMRDAIWWLRSRTWWCDDDFLHNEYFFKCWWGRGSKKCGLSITILWQIMMTRNLFAMITMNICTLQISKSAFARCQQYGRCWRRRSRSHYFPILSGPSGEGCHIHTLPTLDDDQQDKDGHYFF